MAWPGERALHGGADHIPLPQLVPGQLWLCGKHFVAPDPQQALTATEATTVVCLCERHELEARYPSYVAWLAAHHPEGAWWFPIPDLHAPSGPAGRALAGELVRRLGHGERLLMHCGAGIGRAGTMAVAVLMALGYERVEASALVASSRPMAGPQSNFQRQFLVAFSSETTPGA